MPDLNAFYIRDRIKGTRDAVKWNSQITGARLSLRRNKHCKKPNSNPCSKMTFQHQSLRSKFRSIKHSSLALDYNSSVGGKNGKLEAGAAGRLSRSKRHSVTERQAGSWHALRRNQPGHTGLGVSRSICRISREPPRLRGTRNAFPGCRLSRRRASGRSRREPRFSLVRSSAAWLESDFAVAEQGGSRQITPADRMGIGKTRLIGGEEVERGGASNMD